MPATVPTKDEFDALTQRVTALEQAGPQPNQPSPDGTTVTTIGPAITDKWNVKYTIVAADASAKGQQVAINGTRDTRTANVTKLYAKGGQCLQQNTANNWYIADNASPPNWTQTSDPTGVTPPTPTGAWSMQNGRLYRSGKLIVPYGPALLDSEMSGVPASTIKRLFPSPAINAVNLALGADGNGYATARPLNEIFAWVDDAISKGLMVQLSDYVPGQPQVRSGGDLDASTNWLGSLAKYYAGNDNVFWTMQNEVNSGNGGLNNAWQRAYDAIRSNGSNTPIFFEARCGNAQDTGGFDASLLNGKHLVGVNIHLYPWEYSKGGDQTSYDNQTRGYVSKWRQFVQSPDGGPVCVAMGEGGNSTSGNGVAPDDPVVNGKYAVTQSILNTTGASDGCCLAFPWLWDWHGQVSPGTGDADTLVLNNALTPRYGVQCSQFTPPTQ